MLKKLLIIMVILTASLFLFYGCSETDEYPETPEPTQIIQPTEPTLTPEPEDKLITVNQAELLSSNEMAGNFVNSSRLNCYAGSITLLVTFSKDIDINIKEYIYINDEPINPDYVIINANVIRILLSDDLPYLYNFRIKAGYKRNDFHLAKDYSLEFLHEQALTSEISYYTSLNYESSHAIYITTDHPSFLFKFNKPVNQDSLTLSLGVSIMDFSTQWLSDREVLLTINKIDNGRYTIGIERIEGQSDIFGNTLFLKSAYETTYDFEVKDKQKIYSVEPETNIINTLYELDYGVLFEGMSKDSRYMSLGIVTDYSNFDYIGYSRAFLNLETKRLTTFDSFISESLSAATENPIKIKDSEFYNPYFKRDYWNNEGQYFYLYNNSIFIIDPNELTSDLLYKSQDIKKSLYPIPLKNGNYAIVSSPLNNNDFIAITLIDSGGNILNEFELPFKEYSGNGLMWFLENAVDSNDGYIIVSGVEFNEENNPSFITYRLNPENGSMTLISENVYLIGIYPELGFGLYRKYDYDTEQLNLLVISFNGSLLKSIPMGSSTAREYIYNPQKNVFYILRYNLANIISSLQIMDATTFEITNSPIAFDKYVEMLGISQSGELLLMDIVN